MLPNTDTLHATATPGTSPAVDTVISTREAAARCRVSTETIRRWIRSKGLPAYNTELGLKIRIRTSDLVAFAARHNILLVDAPRQG